KQNILEPNDPLSTLEEGDFVPLSYDCSTRIRQVLLQVCSSPQKCMCRMLEMCFSRTRPSRFQSQGQSKVTARENFCVVEAGLVQSCPFYIKGQLCALRPEISLILNTFVSGLVPRYYSCAA
uniref:Uncharacterized protein n=1 Tax=Geospiza parvula TaxID=87175 RepID=A0A8C3MN88_GEOPR